MFYSVARRGAVQICNKFIIYCKFELLYKSSNEKYKMLMKRKEKSWDKVKMML